MNPYLSLVTGAEAAIAALMFIAAKRYLHKEEPLPVVTKRYAALFGICQIFTIGMVLIAGPASYWLIPSILGSAWLILLSLLMFMTGWFERAEEREDQKSLEQF